MGTWITKPDAYNYYHTAFATDKAATGLATVKKIKCDRVQAMHVYLSGNKKAIRECLAGINWDELNRIIVRE